MFRENQELLAMIIAGVGLILFLVTIFILSIVRYRHRIQKDLQAKHEMEQSFQTILLQSKIETQEETFSYIAKELHDNVGQLLSTTKMLLSVTEMQLGFSPGPLVTATESVGKAITELRLVSRSLDREWLEQFNLVDNLQYELDRLNSIGIIKAALVCSCKLSMQTDEQIILFRIIQEALQNAIRHAMPSRLTIIISEHDNCFEILIHNDGIPLANGFAGMGTNNMRSRAAMLGGDINWLSDGGEGTTVKIQIPIKNTYGHKGRIG